MLLPAHAYTSGGESDPDGGSGPDRGPGLTCTVHTGTVDGPVLGHGADVPASTTLFVVFTISPNPGAGAGILIEQICDGILQSDFAVSTEADGQRVLGPINSASDPCGVGVETEFRGHYEGLEASCTWTAVDAG